MEPEPRHPHDTSSDPSSFDANNPFVTTLEAIRSGTYVSGYIYDPDGTAWTPTDRDKSFLPPLTMHELHHYLPQPQFNNNYHVPPPPPPPPVAAAPTTEYQEYQQPQPTSFIPTTSAPGLFARDAAAHPQHRHQHQLQQHDHSSLTRLQATPPSPLSPIQDLSSPVKPPDTPTPAPRVTRQRSSGSRKHLVEMEEEGAEEEDEEEEDESFSDPSTPEDSADEDYQPNRQRRVKKMMTTTTAVRRSSRRTSGLKPDV